MLRSTAAQLIWSYSGSPKQFTHQIQLPGLIAAKISGHPQQGLKRFTATRSLSQSLGGHLQLQRHNRLVDALRNQPVATPDQMNRQATAIQHLRDGLLTGRRGVRERDIRQNGIAPLPQLSFHHVALIPQI